MGRHLGPRPRPRRRRRPPHGSPILVEFESEVTRQTIGKHADFRSLVRTIALGNAAQVTDDYKAFLRAFPIAQPTYALVRGALLTQRSRRDPERLGHLLAPALVRERGRSGLAIDHRPLDLADLRDRAIGA